MNLYAANARHLSRPFHILGFVPARPLAPHLIQKTLQQRFIRLYVRTTPRLLEVAHRSYPVHRSRHYRNHARRHRAISARLYGTDTH
ncbi:hypothetical protein D3C77_456250 [compost metagenome]